MVRTPLLVAVLFIALFAGGCSAPVDAGGATASAPPTSAIPSPTPTPDLVRWAGEVCAAREDVIGAVIELGKNLRFDPTAGGSALDQFQTQLDGQMAGVTAAMDSLGSVLGQVPVDYVEASALVSTLEASGDLVSTHRDETMKQLTAVKDAGDPLTMAAALVQAGVSAKATYEAGRVFISQLNDGTATTRGEMGRAFDEAPLCG